MSTIPIRDACHTIDANDANLAFSKFEDVRLAESSFCQVSLQEAKFEDVVFDGSSFHRVSFVDVAIREGHYEGMTIDGISVKELLEAHRKQTR